MNIQAKQQYMETLRETYLKGNRKKKTEILLHQVMGGARGQASEIEITAKQIIRIKEEMNKILSKHTGQSLAKISKDTDRDFYLSAEEAKEYGVIDEVINTKKF